MWKPNKILIKKGFKSIFKTKLFSILMFVIVLISGTAYTMLESSSTSLKKSYDYAMANGKLADSVIKVNFVPDSSANIEIGLTNATGDIYESEINETTIKNYGQKDGNKWTLNLKAQTNSDFEVYNNQIRNISFIENLNDTFSDELEYVNKQAEAFKGEITQKVTTNLSTIFTETLNAEFPTQLVAKNTQSLSVSTDFNAYKMVNLGNDLDQDKAINIMNIYDGTKLITSPLSDQELLEELKIKILLEQKDIDDFNFNLLKGYKATAVNAIGNSISVVDPSAYEAIISPGYANANDKISLTHEQINLIFKEEPNLFENLNQVSKEKINREYGQSIIWVDNTPYFIVGIGTTPDFAYPIIDSAHSSIDVKNQAIVFTNNRGYERIYDAFRTNPTENYIAIKYSDRLSDQEITSLEAKIAMRARDGNSYNRDHEIDPNGEYNYPNNQWPSNINVLTKITDRNDQSLLIQERVAFLGDLNKTITTLSYVTTSLLVLFLSAVILMIFNVLISINRKTFATMLALGYSRTKVALINSLSSIILVGLPSLIGYLIGYFSQYWFTSIFDNYWTLPTYADSFSVISLLLVGIVPLIFVGMLIGLVTHYQLRRPIPTMLNEANDIGSSFFTKLFSKFKVFGIMGKYALGLTAKNISKLLLLMVTALISLSALMVGFGSVDKANLAYNQTINMINYNFAVELYSPTFEGGQYQPLKSNTLSSLPKNIPTYNDDGDGNVDLDQAHWHVPSVADTNYGLDTSAIDDNNIVNASSYLKNKLQTKVLLNKEVAGLVPWDIAERLMPENQRNIANEDAEKTLGIDSDTLTPDQQIDYRLDHNDMPYIISYNNVIIDPNDELYTYIDAKFIDNGGDNFHIEGLNLDTEMINIDHDLLAKVDSSTETLPILVNKYLAEKYNLSPGKKIKIKVENHAQRNFKDFTSQEIEATIIDVVEGYDATGIYTTRKIANKIIGLDQIDSEAQTGFNAVFSKEENPSILKTLPLYSPSGIYIGADAIYGGWKNVMTKILGNTTLWNYGDTITSDINEFNQIYSTTPYVGATSLVNWREINKLTFANISTLSSTIILIIEIISITLSIVFTLIVASLLLVANRKKIATLWTLGYRKSEIIRVFLSIYILPMIIATAIAVPIALGVLEIMKLFVMSFGNILIPFGLSWWVPIVAIILVSLIFIITTVVMIKGQKEGKVLAAFKGD